MSQALLGQSATPYRAAQELAAQLAVSPSVLTPNVASAMAAAGAAAAAQATAQGLTTPGFSSHAVPSAAGLEVIKAKLETLKQQISGKTKKMTAEKRAKVQGQIEKLENSLRHVEQQRVSLCTERAGFACDHAVGRACRTGSSRGCS
jgi:hypothetical protein